MIIAQERAPIAIYQFIIPEHGGTDYYEKCAATARSCCRSSVLASVKIFE